MNTLTDSFRRGIRQTFVYAGRTGRAEYWWYAVTLGLLAAIIDKVLFEVEVATGSAVPLLFRSSTQLAVTVTLFGATVRRLHDTGRAAYWAVPWAAAGLSAWALTLVGISANADDVSDAMAGVFALVVGVGGLAVLPCFVFMFFRGHTEPNRYGPPPTRPRGAGGTPPQPMC